MSYTELHFGKLKPIKTEMSLEDLKVFLQEDERLFVEDLEEKIEDEHTFFEIQQGDWRGEYLYIYNKGTLYEVVEHKDMGEESDVDITTVNTDGTINFTYMFYNGGTCFSEMLERGLNRANKK